MLLFCVLVVISGERAAAAEPPVLWGKNPPICPTGSTGSEAGHCEIPRGVAANPSNGHIFVADQANSRINEFNALGQFIKAWGWGVDTGAAELQTCTAASTCQAGAGGGGAGQFAEIAGAQGISLDSAGNVYVQDRGGLGNPNVRVQKFSPEGKFLLMFGGEVNKTKVEEGTAGEGEENLCPFDSGDECGAGTIGLGQGQFGEWAIGSFIAIDGNGTATTTDDNVYVGDQGRIQVFDTDGHYSDEISLPGRNVQGLAVDPAGDLYYIDNGQVGIHKISPAGMPLAPEIFELPKLGGEQPAPTAVAVDSVGDVFAFGPTNEGNPTDPLFEFDKGGNVIAEFGKGEFSGSTGLATNLCTESEPPGNFYVTNASFSEAFLRSYGTEPLGCFNARTAEASEIEAGTATLNGTVNPNGEAITECFFEYGTSTLYDHNVACEDPSAGEIGTGSSPVSVHAKIAGLEKGTIYHFRLTAEIGGETEPGADETFKTLGPPVVSDDHTTGSTDTEAGLSALVNPEGLATTCHFEYVTQAAFEANGFEGAQITTTTALGSDRSDHPIVASLKDLAGGAAYRWRLLCANSSGSSESKAHQLFTYLPFVAESDCPVNQAFRGGASAFLPDCRVYEMVSPVDKNGGDITREVTGAGEAGGYVQASLDGNSITYTSLAAFANPPAAVNFNQYLALRREKGRSGEGWSSEALHAPVAGQEGEEHEFFNAFREFMAFTPDLCSAWLIDRQTPPPTADGQVSLANLYRRDNCEPGVGAFEVLVPLPQLPVGTPDRYVERNSVEGYSADGRHVIFTAKAQLTSQAATGTNPQLYDRFGGALHLVSVLPDGDGEGIANPAPSAAGSGSLRNLVGAVSEDGSRVYWVQGTETGKLYLREHPEQGIVANECSAPGMACTRPVSIGSSAFFWAGSGDGSKALYSEGESLYEFDLQEAKEGNPPQQIAGHVKGVAGASDDLARIYFVSTDVMPGAGQNSEGKVAQAGQPNLYLAEGANFNFVATLLAGDVGALEPGATTLSYSLVEREPYLRATRVSPDGRRIAFNSRAGLTSYDNTDPAGRPSVEVFSYEAGGALLCVSCNPSGARPNGVREMREPFTAPWRPGNATKVPAAAWIPTWEHSLHASNALSADGRRIFFGSNDALLPRDRNGTADVYEWEALGTGGCARASTGSFPQNGGCLYLISSGESSFESEFWEASPDGHDVFFTTESSLLPQDPGSVDLYDARVGGGFPQPAAKAPCEGEACQSPPPPPQLPTPASGTYRGPVDPIHRRRCPKGKHLVGKGGKVRCAKKKINHKKGRRRRAGRNGRAGR